MAEKPLRILVSGDVDGRFDQLFSRINSIQKKSGQFDLLLCVGNFFGDDTKEWQKYSSGSVKVPLPILTLGANVSEHESLYSQNGELCDNVTYLGKKGLYTGSSGLQLAYISGVESDIISDGSHFNPVDISALTDTVKNDTNFKGVDILITSQWPNAVDKYATEVGRPVTGSGIISQLALHLRPRYHFCALEDIHYERQPYRNHTVLAEAARHVTRFIALAKVGNKRKEKYLYAFNITPLSRMSASELTAQPEDVTECPYSKSNITTLPQQDTQEQFFYDTSAGRGEKRQSKNEGGKHQKKQRAMPTGPCWFCLGSPEVEKHLVVSVGTECYVALAKGGLVEDHVLILPIGHYQSTVTAPDDVLDEINKYKKALKKYCKKSGKAIVFFERNFKTQHLQIQAVPVPMESIQNCKEIFLEHAEEEGIMLNEIPSLSDIKQIVDVGIPYFYVELPDGSKLYSRIEAKKRFPLQFGREVLASEGILDCPDRVDWKVCSKQKTEEEYIAQKFKDKFKKYDFTLD